MFDALSEHKRYLPKDAKTVGDTDSDPFPGGMTREFFALYDVPVDAKGLRLNKRLFQQDGFVELGMTGGDQVPALEYQTPRPGCNEIIARFRAESGWPEAMGRYAEPDTGRRY